MHFLTLRVAANKSKNCIFRLGHKMSSYPRHTHTAREAAEPAIEWRKTPTISWLLARNRINKERKDELRRRRRQPFAPLHQQNLYFISLSDTNTIWVVFPTHFFLFLSLSTPLEVILAPILWPSFFSAFFFHSKNSTELISQTSVCVVYLLTISSHACSCVP